jgi:hypothetical protein
VQVPAAHRAIADVEVDLAAREVRVAERGRQLDAQVGVCGEECAQPRHQPKAREARRTVDAQHLDAFGRARVVRRARNQRQRAGDVASVALADRRQHEAAGRALEEPAPDEAFQVGDLLADRGGGHVQFISRLVDAPQAGGHLERDDSLERRQVHCCGAS